MTVSYRANAGPHPGLSVGQLLNPLGRGVTQRPVRGVRAGSGLFPVQGGYTLVELPVTFGVLLLPRCHGSFQSEVPDDAGDSPAISPSITSGRAARGVRLRRGGRCASARHDVRPRPVMVMAAFASRTGAAPAWQMSGLGRAFAILGAGAGPSAIRGKTASRPCPPLSRGVFPAARAVRAGCERWAGGQNCDVRFTNTPRFGLSMVRRSSDTLPQR